MVSVMNPAKQMRALLPCILFLLPVIFSCSSGPEVKKQAFAKLSNQQTYEYEFPVVWKGIEEALRKFRVKERDPKEVGTLEMRKLKKRTLETDWVYGQSRDKYNEFKVKGVPKKVMLQTRFKYSLVAQRSPGGVDVTVDTQEEVERLDDEGTPTGYEKVSETDSSRPAELLEKIKFAIYSAAP